MNTPQPDSSPVSRSFSRQVRPAVGETLAERYRLERESAHSEAGLVFDATDTRSGRRVAIELASSLEDPKARRKWARDAMMAQRLEGEHVLRVLEVGNTQSNVPFVVREPAVSTLAAELDARGPLPVEQAVGWTLEACEAVAEAHAVGMAHGDLRLDNVYLARGTDHPTVKVAWTSAAKAERAAKEDVQRDIAGLGAMLRVLATGRQDVEADGAATLPSDVAHAVSRALSQSPEGAFHNVSELARELAPFAPPGHGSARTVAFLMSRSGIVGGPIPGSGPASGPSSKRASVLAPVGPNAQAGGDRASFTDEWFGHGARASHAGSSLAAPARGRGVAFTVVSLLLVGAVLGGTWLLFSNGKLPRWTGAAPPEEVGTTQVTSAPDENAQAAALAAAEAQRRAAANDQAEAELKANAAAEQQKAEESAKAKASAASKPTSVDPPSAPRSELRTTTPAETVPTAVVPSSPSPASEPAPESTSSSPIDTAPVTTTPAVPAVPVPTIPVPTVAPTSPPAPVTPADPSSTPF